MVVTMKGDVWLYQCPKCDKVYRSPLELIECGHRCPKDAKGLTGMLFVRKENEDG